MGQLLSICPGHQGTSNEEVKTEFNCDINENIIVSSTPTNKPSEELEDENKRAQLIQKHWKKKNEKNKVIERIKVIDENLDKIGKHVSIDIMKSKIPPAILAVESKLVEYKGSPADLGYFDSKLTFRSPIQFNLDNSIYHGQWNTEGLREGYGILVTDDNIKYEGLWLEGKLFKGRIFREDGSYYEGEIKELRANGEGAIYLANGGVYKGTFLDDQQIGNGSRTFVDGFKYEGAFENDNYHGLGSFFWPDGSVNEGQFENSSFKGKGVFITPLGDVFEGIWNNNLPNGPGKYYFSQKNAGIVYEGDYKNGKKEGKGRLTFSKEKYYEGEWINGLPHGQAVLNNGSMIIKGVWRHGSLVFSESLINNKQDSLIPNVKENFKDKASLLHLKDQTLNEFIGEQKNPKGKNYRPSKGQDILQYVSRLSIDTNLNYISTAN